eukprot:gene6793-10957_t
MPSKSIEDANKAINSWKNTIWYEKFSVQEKDTKLIYLPFHHAKLSGNIKYSVKIVDQKGNVMEDSKRLLLKDSFQIYYASNWNEKEIKRLFPDHESFDLSQIYESPDNYLNKNSYNKPSVPYSKFSEDFEDISREFFKKEIVKRLKKKYPENGNSFKFEQLQIFETPKHEIFYLPIYRNIYRYQNNFFTILVNGVNGKVVGDGQISILSVGTGLTAAVISILETWGNIELIGATLIGFGMAAFFKYYVQITNRKDDDLFLEFGDNILKDSLDIQPDGFNKFEEKFKKIRKNETLNNISNYTNQIKSDMKSHASEQMNEIKRQTKENLSEIKSRTEGKFDRFRTKNKDDNIEFTSNKSEMKKSKVSSSDVFNRKQHSIWKDSSSLSNDDFFNTSTSSMPEISKGEPFQNILTDQRVEMDSIKTKEIQFDQRDPFEENFSKEIFSTNLKDPFQTDFSKNFLKEFEDSKVNSSSRGSKFSIDKKRVIREELSKNGDFYKILGLNESRGKKYTNDTIQRNYMKLEKNLKRQGDLTELHRVKVAYDILSDPSKRQVYDEMKM